MEEQTFQQSCRIKKPGNLRELCYERAQGDRKRVETRSFQGAPPEGQSAKNADGNVISGRNARGATEESIADGASAGHAGWLKLRDRGGAAGRRETQFIENSSQQARF
jgi:hypothetical protein